MNRNIARMFRRRKKEKAAPATTKPEEAGKPRTPVPEQDMVVFAAGIACAGQSLEKER